ncbi:MAG: hypothetical protein Q8909_09335 [Bacteroidota bacterium]|nr:hypothetical protein [Bacteroidota bacterium]
MNEENPPISPYEISVREYLAKELSEIDEGKAKMINLEEVENVLDKVISDIATSHKINNPTHSKH